MYTMGPAAESPNTGVGYARVPVAIHLTGDMNIDYPCLQAACTDEVFSRLMQEYCLANKGVVQFSVYLPTGTMGCARQGCAFHACPH